MSNRGLRQAAEVALEYMLDALVSFDQSFDSHPSMKADRDVIVEDINALRQALKQEPVAWIVHEDGVRGLHWSHPRNGMLKVEPLYTAPPKREWVGLTSDEIWEIFTHHDPLQYSAFSSAIEAKLKEKNT